MVDDKPDIRLCAHPCCFKYFKPKVMHPNNREEQLYCSRSCVRQANKWRKNHPDIFDAPQVCRHPEKKIRMKSKSEIRAYVIRKNYHIRPYFCVCHQWHVATAVNGKRFRREDVMKMFGVAGK